MEGRVVPVASPDSFSFCSAVLYFHPSFSWSPFGGRRVAAASLGPCLCLWQEPEGNHYGKWGVLSMESQAFPEILRYSSHVPLPMGTGVQLQRRLQNVIF